MKVKKNHLFPILLLALVQGCFDQSGTKYCPNVEPAVNADSNFFAHTNHSIDFVGTSDHQLAISCHNCYENLSSQAFETNRYIESAIASNVDFIELDIVMSDTTGQVPHVSHEDRTSGPLFTDIIANPFLINASQILFIEIKGPLDLKANIRGFINSLMQHRFDNGSFAYFNPQRFTVIRSIETDKTLARFREVLAEEEFAGIRPFVKFSRLFYPKETSKMFNEIDQVYSCGFHMVEFDTRLGIEAIKLLASYADTLGLAINVFTLDESNYLPFVSELKYDVDVLTVEAGAFSEDAERSLFQKVRELFLND